MKNLPANERPLRLGLDDDEHGLYHVSSPPSGLSFSPSAGNPLRGQQVSARQVLLADWDLRNLARIRLRMGSLSECSAARRREEV